MRRMAAGLYVTLDGRYQIERQDGTTTCEHPLCDTLHQRFHTYNANAPGEAMHWMTYVQWHVWDNERDDYAGHDSREFGTLAEARSWLDHHLAKALSPSEPW